ncbi:hypothetical protein E4U43_006333 [Claviceps pusilla]|uniref:F-box domain-containing protein n=1 Tax=Claviceps pusilla TaxID=123648 RepID=A0A9P7NE88_9HYPO|nr:hypothetical protein E4U43_006333 [Claviceps pusilla]
MTPKCETACLGEKYDPADFFTLPVEIRLIIYRMVLALETPLSLFKEARSRMVESFILRKPVRWLSLLHTNRQVNREASAVLYGQHHFILMDMTPLQLDLQQ